MTSVPFSLSYCFCPEQHNQSSQKQVTHQQLISIKKELNTNKESMQCNKNKLSITCFKKKKIHCKQDHGIKDSQQRTKDPNKTQKLSIINSIKHSSVFDNRIKDKQSNISTKFYEQKLKTSFNYSKAFYGNNSITRKINTIQNYQQQIVRSNSSRFKQKIFVPKSNYQLNQNHKFVQSNITLNNSPCFPYKHKRFYSQITTNSQSLPIIKSIQLTLSTIPSHQNILTKQIQPIFSSPKANIHPISPISIKHQPLFPDGFRKVQSLEDNDSQFQQLSIVLDSLPFHQIKQIKTERNYEKDLLIINLSERPIVSNLIKNQK